MAQKKDLVATIKKDMLNLAQNVRCGGCFNTINFGGNFKAYTIKGHKFPDSEEKPEGLLCEDCQRFEAKVKEGPLLAVRMEGPNEDTPREYPVNNLPLDQDRDELAVTAGGIPVFRSPTTGKLKKLGKDVDADEILEGTSTEPSTVGMSRPEIDALRGSRREK